MTRRESLKLLTASAAGALLVPHLTGCGAPSSGFDFGLASGHASPTYPFSLPDLPYAYEALAPHIDARTMEIHHGRHHQGYTNKLNTALEGHPDLHETHIVDLLADLDAVPETIRTAVRNSGGGFLNHALFWPSLSPDGGGTPSGPLAEALESTFGSFADFQTAFAAAAGSVFGSGWAWLAQTPNGDLEIVKTVNQDSPLTQGHKPLLGIDVWEHAYYLNYQNRRADYIAAFWDIVNWPHCEQVFVG